MPGRIRRSFSPLCYHRARVSKEKEKHFTQAPFAHGPPTQPSQEEKGKFNKAEWGGEKRRWKGEGEGGGGGSFLEHARPSSSSSFIRTHKEEETEEVRDTAAILHYPPQTWAQTHLDPLHPILGGAKERATIVTFPHVCARVRSRCRKSTDGRLPL